MERQRERWSSRAAFIFAAIGSAIGLGNIWRFPYIVYKNGGGAFLIPYFVALLTAGIPLMILEYYVGQKYQGGAPVSLKKVWNKSEWVGWFAIIIAFLIVSYYSVIMSWAVDYLYQSFSLGWGSTAAEIENFFNVALLNKSASPGIFGGLQIPVVIGLGITWVLIYLCLFKGIETLGKIVYFTVGIPWLILIVMVIRGITLPGAIDGLNFYLTPDFSVLLNPRVWLEAYAQVFFTLSLGMGILIVYSSHLPEDSDISANAFITSLANCGTAFFAGLAVFSTLGYMARATGVAIPDVTTSGISLAFITYPTAINLLPVASRLFGALFFVLLLTLGIDSAFSLVESAAGAFEDKWNFRKRPVLISICVVGFLFGLIYATRAGIHWLDIVDHYACCYGVALVGLLECIIVGYVFGAEKARTYINEYSDFSIGKWWNLFVRYITPLVLGIAFVMELVKLIRQGYGGYASWTTFVGIGMIVVALLVSYILSRQKGSVS